MSLRKLAVLFASIAVSTAMLGCVLTIAIWPGEAKLTAPLFCEDPYNQPMVVSDTFVDSEGTGTNFTLYCVGDRGEFTDEGFLLPWLAVWAAHTLIVFVLALLIAAATRRRPEISDTESVI
ncbi:hypothetical protein ACFQZZ_01735 [Nocardia sp. GCM10030253]|uniref:hypothetical protein n=1 Tax=Nocardia sp. GCM10030253 TaxID=3273404 RepID=UPI003645E33D